VLAPKARRRQGPFVSAGIHVRGAGVWFTAGRLWITWLALWVGLLSVACSGEPSQEGSPPLGRGQLADACDRTEDCASGLCVRLDSSGGICSQACDTDFDCPMADNWACLASSLSDVQVCACRKLDSRELCSDDLDNDCNGEVDDCQLCSGQYVSYDDPLHCGSCNNACQADQMCQDRACTCSDPAQTVCGGTCVDTSTDVGHCGACGVACGPEQQCHDGQCVCPDAEPDFCPGVGCVDQQSDADHCGACGESCTLARTCQGGDCICPDAQAPDFCAGVGCVDFQSSALHCGGCEQPCPSGLVCSNGACECPPGMSSCDGECVDTDTNAAHCGECDVACGSGQACSGGECGCTSLGFSECGTECYDFDTNPEHCGGCNDACATGEECLGGDCDCESGLYCGGDCIALDDDDNCGACGKSCADGQECSAGECVCQGSGLTACGDDCFALSSDEAHCGSCEISCKNGQSCSAGQCRCPAGQTYCDQAGTCVDLASDEAHCGVCGSACDPTETCQSGVCKCATTAQLFCASQNACTDLQNNAAHCGACDQACDPTEICQNKVCKCPASGQAFCESENACINLQTDADHCGACDDPCRATEVCQSGACKCPLGGQVFCDTANACVDISSDEEHCGACNVACPVETSCVSKVCQCDAVGQTLCPDSLCYDLQDDPTHCGACGTNCGNNSLCVAGVCKCPAPTVGLEVRLTNTPADDRAPSAAWNGAHVGVAYFAAGDVRFALLEPNGSVVSDQLLTSGAPLTLNPQIKLIWSGSEFALVYALSSAATPTGMLGGALEFLRLDATGTLKGAAVPLGDIWGTPGLAWSSSYGGYAVGYTIPAVPTSLEYLTLRRLGVDGSAPEAPNEYYNGIDSNFPNHLAAGPGGIWLLGAVGGGFAFGDVSYQLYNADGTRNGDLKMLGKDYMPYPGRGPALLHDGSAFALSWPGTGGDEIFLYRTTATTAAKVVTVVAPQQIIETDLELVRGTLAIGWLQRSSNANNAKHRFRMSRLSIPTTATSAAGALHDPVDVLAQETIARTQSFDLVATGNGSMLGVWSDDRHGAAELYAAPIDVQSCP
jgi:hypothetical protein